MNEEFQKKIQTLRIEFFPWEPGSLEHSLWRISKVWHNLEAFQNFWMEQELDKTNSFPNCSFLNCKA